MQVSLSTLDRDIKRGESEVTRKAAASACGSMDRSIPMTRNCCAKLSPGRTRLERTVLELERDEARESGSDISRLRKNGFWQ